MSLQCCEPCSFCKCTLCYRCEKCAIHACCCRYSRLKMPSIRKRAPRAYQEEFCSLNSCLKKWKPPHCCSIVPRPRFIPSLCCSTSIPCRCCECDMPHRCFHKPIQCCSKPTLCCPDLSLCCLEPPLCCPKPLCYPGAPRCYPKPLPLYPSYPVCCTRPSALVRSSRSMSSSRVKRDNVYVMDRIRRKTRSRSMSRDRSRCCMMEKTPGCYRPVKCMSLVSLVVI